MIGYAVFEARPHIYISHLKFASELHRAAFGAGLQRYAFSTAPRSNVAVLEPHSEWQHRPVRSGPAGGLGRPTRPGGDRVTPYSWSVTAW